MKTLADFKRALKKPGARLQLVSHSYARVTPETKPWMFVPRAVVGVYSSHFTLDTHKPGELGGPAPSRMDFGKASEWCFAGNRAIYAGDGFRMVYDVLEAVKASVPVP